MPSTKTAKRSAKKPARGPSPAPVGSKPDEHRIRERAYELYLERGAAPGQELDDWERARRELVAGPRTRRRV